MKILLYGINCAPELTGIVKYTGERAAGLSLRAQGCHCGLDPQSMVHGSRVEPGMTTRGRNDSFRARPVIATAHAGTELARVVGGRGADLSRPGGLKSALQGTGLEAYGLVVPPEDAVAFANAVRTLAADPALRQRLGAAGFEADLQALRVGRSNEYLPRWSGALAAN